MPSRIRLAAALIVATTTSLLVAGPIYADSMGTTDALMGGPSSDETSGGPSIR